MKIIILFGILLLISLITLSHSSYAISPHKKDIDKSELIHIIACIKDERFTKNPITIAQNINDTINHDENLCIKLKHFDKVILTEKVSLEHLTAHSNSDDSEFNIPLKSHHIKN